MQGLRVQSECVRFSNRVGMDRDLQSLSRRIGSSKMWKSRALLLVVESFLLIVAGWAQQGRKVVSYSTYLGGAGAQESINDIKVDAGGSMYVTYEDYDDTGPSHDF